MPDVLVLTNSHVPRDARVYHKMARTLAADYTVTIACPGPVPPDEDRICWHELSRSGRWYIESMISAAVQQRPDVILCVEPVTMLAGIIARRRLHGKPRLVYDCHEWFALASAENAPRMLRPFKRWLYTLVENALLRRMDAAITVNEALAQRLRRACSDVTVCANYPVPCEPEPQPAQYDAVYAGGIGRNKGMLKLLQAAVLLRRKRPDLRILFLGRFLTPGDQAAFDAFVAANGLDECVNWGGQLPHDEVQRHIAASRVGVVLLDTTIARYRQALSLKLLEYFQCGVPVVANDTPIVREVMRGEEVGLCISYNSFALAAALERLLSLPSHKRDEMAARARQLVNDSLNWSSQQPQLLKLFARLSDDRRLLMLSYFYPPLGGPGVQRPCKMVHYLRRLGWRTDVVSVGDIVTLSYEPAMLRECDHASLHRTPSLDPMWLLKRLRRGGGGDRVYFGTSEGRKRIVRGMFPIEDKIGWLPFAAWRALRLARRNHYHAVVAVMGPYTAGIAGYIVSKLTGLPLVLDYRDHWTLFPYEKYLTRWHKRLAQSWERRVLNYASRVSILGEVYREELCEAFGEHLRSKIHIVRNGWDERDFAGIEPLPRQHSLQARYVGNFNGHRQPTFFVQALRILKERGELPDGLRITFTGNHFLEAREALTAPDLAGIIEIEPQVSHDEAIRRELGCDLLLLFIASPNGRGVLTGKMFEYLRTGRPILGMVPPQGEAAGILRACGHPHICAMEDVEGIVRLLPLALSEAAGQQQPATTDAAQVFSREAQAQAFDEMLRELP